MPNTHATLASLFGDIADAIRAKTGSQADIVADDFPSAISAISGGGLSDVQYYDSQTKFYAASDTGPKNVAVTCPLNASYTHYISVCYVVNLTDAAVEGYGLALWGSDGSSLDKYVSGINMVTSGNGANRSYLATYTISATANYLFVISAYMLK